jgi:hypothetical protein
VPGPLHLDAWPDGWRQREQTGGEARPEGHATNLIFSLAARTALGSEVRGARRPSGDLGRQAAPCGACLSAAAAAGGRGPCHKNIDKHGRPLLQNPHGRLSTADVVLRAHRLWLRSRPTFWDLFGARSANGRVRLSNAAIHRQSICRPCRICRSSGLAIQASLLFARNFYSPRSARHMPHPLARHHCSAGGCPARLAQPPRVDCGVPAWCGAPGPGCFGVALGSALGLSFFCPRASPLCVWPYLPRAPPSIGQRSIGQRCTRSGCGWLRGTECAAAAAAAGGAVLAATPLAGGRTPHFFYLPSFRCAACLCRFRYLHPPPVRAVGVGDGGGAHLASRHGHSRQFVF